MALILFLVVLAVVVVAVSATFVQVARDGYRPVPTRWRTVRRP